jgi:tetratricopeptide (TPR) repeat protein
MRFFPSQSRFCHQAGLLLAFWLACQSLAVAQDVLHLRRTDGNGETNRKGEILNWTGSTISIKGSSGVKEVDAGRLIRIETAWDPNYENGVAALAKYDYPEASQMFESALDGEQRSWMQNILHAKLLQCFLATENFGRAAEQFLNIVNDDPQSRFLNLIPLVWTSSRPDSLQLKRAKVWLRSNEPAIQLLGASWLLTESDNSEALKTLDTLTSDFDPTIKSLATAQLWRLDKVVADEKRIDLRIAEVKRMPESIRGGPWYLIAESQSRLKLYDKAVVNFMRIPINDPQQGGLAAAALYQAAWILQNKQQQNKQQQNKAQTLRNELKEKFGDTVWAN